MCKRLVYLVPVVLALGLSINTVVAELVAHYPLDEGSGTTAADASGKGHHATIIGNNVEWVESQGGYGWALDFPGTSGQYCDTGTWNPSAATGRISVAFWMKWAGDNGGYQGVVAKRDAWAEESTMWCIEIDADSLVMNWHRYGSWVDVGISPAVGEWQHIVVTYDGSMSRSYVDGNLHREAGGFTFGPATNAHVVFGAVEQNNNPYNGTLDEVRIYDHVISSAEINSLAARFNATNPIPGDGAIVHFTWVNLTWTPGSTAVSHDVYFGDNFNDVSNGTGGTFRGNQTDSFLLVGFPGYPYPEGLPLGVTYYWRIDELRADDTKARGEVWSFTVPSKTAFNPNPPDGAKFIDPNTDLSWSPGLNAVMHYVYFGDDFDTVNNASGAAPHGRTTYDPGTLEFEKTYYWRVDEFDGTATHEGNVWSFTTTVPGLGTILREVWEDIGGDTVADLTGNPRYPDDPSWSDEITVFDFWDLGLDSYGSRLRGWLHVPAAGDYTFWIASDNGSELWLSTDDDPSNVGTAPIAQVPGTNWTGHYEWDKFPEQQSAPITLESGRYYIEALMKEGGGGDGVAVSWQGPGIPTQEVIPGSFLMPFKALWAFAATPANRATDVTQAPTLSWKPGEKAAQHDVYFGDDETAVADANTTTPLLYRGRLNTTEYTPTEIPLDWNKTYYWRIDEVNNLEPDSPWKGTVWSFTTADFIVVDNFESYTDDIDNRIFQTWIDGFGYSEPAPGHPGNGTGSTVGNLTPPFAEQTIIHSGAQSMPFAYNNTGAGGKFYFSETERTLDIPQNWASQQGHELKSLTLWFYGDPCNAVEQLYVALEDSTGRVAPVAYDGNIEDIRVAGWQEWNIELRQFSNANVNLASIKKMYIGVGDRDFPQRGGTGKLYFDDIRLYERRCVPSRAKPSASINGDCVVDYLDVEVMAGDWLVEAILPDDAKLVAHYELTGTFEDSSSYTGYHDGDSMGTGASIITDPERGQVASFDGVDDFVDCGTFNPSAATGQITVAVWAKWKGLTDQWQGLIGKRDAWTTDDTMWCLEIERDTGDCRFFQYDSWPDHGLNVLPVGQWQHIAVSFDGTLAALYINGQSIGGNQAFSFGPKADARVVFGACEANGGNPFNGDLDDVRIYDYVLSPAEILHIAGFPADLNDDKKVNFGDFAVLADTWLEEQLWPQP